MIKKGTLYIILKRCTVAWGLICDTPSTDNSYDYNYCHHLSNPVPHPALLRILLHGRVMSDGDSVGIWWGEETAVKLTMHTPSMWFLLPLGHICSPIPFFVSLLFLYTSLAYLAVSCLMRHVMCHVMWRPQKLTWNHYSLVEKIAGSSAGKESTCSAGDPGSIPGSRISSGEGIGYPLQYSWASLVAQTVKNLPPMQETLVRSLGQEDPLEEGMVTHSSILA